MKEKKHMWVLWGVVAICLLALAVHYDYIDLPDMPTFSIVMPSIDIETSQALQDTPASPECELTSDKSRYCEGDWATVTLEGEPSTAYAVYINKDYLGFGLWGNRVTDYAGHAEQSGYLNDAGYYQIRAMSPTCYSNVLEVEVIPCVSDECWWQSIADEDTSLPGGLYTDWFGSMVTGKFKYEWSYSLDSVDTEISKDSALQTSSTKKSGSYEFSANDGENWRIRAINDVPKTSTVHFELYQWVCEGDVLNWNPDMLGAMGQISQQDLDESCAVHCQDVESYLGGWYAGSEEDCTYQGGIYIVSNGCCCYNQLV